jgi:hypothetical protein
MTDISKCIKYQTEDGLLFDTMEEACKHQREQRFVNEIYDRFTVCGKIKYIDELVLWLITENLINEDAFKKRYGKGE